jgi:hypothetical protein
MWVPSALHRNPKNPEQAWAGIGKRPDWIRTAIDAGEALDSMRIEQRPGGLTCGSQAIRSGQVADFNTPP